MRHPSDDLLCDDPAYAHRNRLRDERGRTMLEHGGRATGERGRAAGERVCTPEKDAALAEIARLKALLRSEHPQGDN